LNIDEILVEDRVRREMGDLDELCNSIKSVGLIQPIVINRENKLIAGERRLRALRKLSITELVHEIHYVFNDELDPLRLKSMEIEENVKRKSLSWQEEILAKKRLLEILQEIHGVARSGNPGSSESTGFGVNKLAALLGESNAQTSKDLELANLISTVPQLAQAETKEAARRQVILGTAIAISLATQAAKTPEEKAKEQRWTLIEGDFTVTSVNSLTPKSVDLVIVDPPYGEDSQGMGPNSKTLLASAFIDSKQPTLQVLAQLAVETYRVLRPDRFAVFFFGFEVYSALVSFLEQVGLEVDKTPLVWIKNTVINTTPYTRYGRSYEPILIARKGEPKMFRPSQRDVLSFDTVITRGTQEQKFYHAQKPLALIEKLILDLTPPESVVCDFCAGSGTTGEAALRTKRRVFLFEKDEVACRIIRARLGAL
jgi:DNA modification methylase